MGGHFTQINGQSRGRIAMLHQDGTLDPTFSTANAADAAVACIAVQADRRILISGQFTKIAGVNRPAIARLESSGDLDTSFVPPVSSTFIRSVGPTDEGTILIAGSSKDASSREVPSWVPDGSDYLWEMERPAVLGVGYGAEWSTTLESGDWHDAEDLSDSETLRFRVSSADKPRLFFRLKVSND